MNNDVLFQHLRALAIVAKSACKAGTPGADAADFIEREFGLEGDIRAEDQELIDLTAVPIDTGVHAAVDGVVESGKKHSDESYLPHLGIYAFSWHAFSKWQDKARHLKLDYGSMGHSAHETMAIPEDDILAWAEDIKAHRKLSQAAKNLREGKSPDGIAYHDGTDARKSTEEGCSRDYENWSDIEKSQSHITITIASGCRYLNGSMAEHQHFVNLEVTGPDGRLLVRVGMSPEQFAAAISTRSLVPCTLDTYWSKGEGAVRLRERVKTPESIIDRMRQRLRGSIGKQDGDLKAIVDTLAERKGKPLGKKDQDELVRALKNVLERRVGSTAFVVEQAMEEGSKLAETATLKVLMAQATTGSALKTIQSLTKSFGQNLLPAPKKD